MRRLLALVPVLSMALASCEGGDSPDTAPAALRPGAPARGPRVKWDLGHRPLPEIPLPNDVATFPDPSSPTGLRLNASLVTPTGFESRIRQGFNELDGWGTFQPVTVAFDEDLDLADLTRRMRGDDHDFTDDAVYLINLTTGLPVPVDMGDGNFVYTAKNRDGYYPNDPRGGQSNLLFETVDEDTNRNGRMDPGEDTNFDGALNRAAVFPAGSAPEDNLSTYWEPDSRTLIVRPLVPLEERTRYAVVLTDRLRGVSGYPVRSPYPTIALPAQSPALEALDGLLRGPASRYYGGLVYRPRATESASNRVTFAWTFTTQTTVSDMLDLRRGLYGEGPFANALRPFTPDLVVAHTNEGSNCSDEQDARPYIIRGAALSQLVEALAQALGVDDAGRQLLVEQYRYVDYIAFGTYRVPYPMGDAANDGLHDRWTLNSRTGEIAHLGSDTVQFAMVVPKALAGHAAPFPVAFMGHGYTGNFTDALGFGPFMAAHGVATVGINAPGHGLVLDAATRGVVGPLLRGMCNGGLVSALTESRARDLNGDDIADSGGNFWTAYVFHTRDAMRQHTLDHMQLIRALRGFDGRARSGVDYNHDGDASNDLAGDFNGDGTPDVGGPDARFYAMGGSLGGIMAMTLGAADSAVRAAAPVSGSGGMTDVGIRSTEGGVKEAVILRVMGPLVESIPSSEYAPSGTHTRTSCRAGQSSLRFIVPDLNSTGELEFACADVLPAGSTEVRPDGTTAAIAPGDDVVVLNVRNDERRCARAGVDGRLRIGIPTDDNDPLQVFVYRGAAVTDYGTCALSSSAEVRALIGTQRVIEGDCDQGCGHIPPDARASSPVRRWSVRDAQLRAPAEGLGIRRQTPEMRRFLLLAQAALDAADPVSWAPMYFLRRPSDHPQHALLVVNTIGDQAVPISTGNAFARAAGLIPFMAPSTATRFAELTDYATPQGLFDRYGRTPNRVLIDRGVLEGLANARRFPVTGHDDYLFDVDDLDEGAQRFGEQTLAPPLRLVRRAARAESSLDAAWQPTLASWSADTGPSAGVLNAYIVPRGTHSFALPESRDAWHPQTYLLHTIGHFFATDGRDLYYRSHPTEHACAERATCSFIAPRPATQ